MATLGEMIDSKRRLVVFMDYEADQDKVPYILDEFTYFWETEFSKEDPTFQECLVHRPDKDSDTRNRFSLINHTANMDLTLGLLGDAKLLIPGKSQIDNVNSLHSITRQARDCANLHGRMPNVILVDFVDRVNKGDLMGAQKVLNNLSNTSESTSTSDVNPDRPVSSADSTIQPDASSDMDLTSAVAPRAAGMSAVGMGAMLGAAGVVAAMI